MNNDQSSLILASVLDRIDHKRESEGNVPQNNEERTTSKGWVEYVDPTTGKPYYFNTTSKVTQWEKPPESEWYAVDASHQNTDQSGAVSSAQPLVADIPYGWAEYFDPVSKLPYYYNMILKTTQWAKPKDFEASTKSLTAECTTEYSEKAYFCKESGRFSGTSSYWQKMGRPDDKAGRQLGVFMDLSTLEENREQARLMKEEARKNSGSRGDVKWSDYKEEKKAAKKRKASAWVFDP